MHSKKELDERNRRSCSLRSENAHLGDATQWILCICKDKGSPQVGFIIIFI